MGTIKITHEPNNKTRLTFDNGASMLMQQAEIPENALKAFEEKLNEECLNYLANMKPFDKKIIFIVEKTSTGYSAYAKDYPLFTTGSTIKELKANALEVSQLCFEEDGYVIKKSNIVLKL